MAQPVVAKIIEIEMNFNYLNRIKECPLIQFKSFVLVQKFSINRK